MSTRESLSRRCILLKQVPDDIDEECIRRRIHGVEKSHRYNEFSLEPCEVRWVVLLANIESAEKLIRNSQVPVLSCFGTECNLRVGPCPECIIPDDWLEPLTPDRISMNFPDDQMMDSIGMSSIREREQENNAPKTDVFKRVEEKEEEEENQDTYVPKFVIPAISSPYSGPNYMADSNDSRPYSSIKSQLSEEKDEANHDSNPGVTKSEDFDSDPEKIPTMVNVSSRKNGDDEDPYATIDDVNLKSFVKEDHDTPPSLPERPGRTESKDEFSSTYLEPVSINKNGAKETESASDEYQSNNPWNGGDHPDELQCAQPQILSNPNAEVNASTYIEPLKRNSSANESNKQVPLSLPSKPHEENHFQPYENASIGSNMKVPTSLEENSNTGCQTTGTTNTAKLYPVIGEDCNKIPQTLVNEAYKSQGAIPKVTRGNTHPGSVGKDVDALYQNHEMIKRPDPSPSVPETGQNRPDRMPAGFSGATPAPGNFVDQTEAKFAPQNGPLPPFFPNFMMAPQNQQIPMPNFMDPKYQQQQNIQGFPRTPYPGFPVPFFPFGQLPNQGNNIPQTGEIIPMPEPQLPVVPKEAEGEIPVAKTEEVESETKSTNLLASPQRRKKKQSVTPKQEDQIDDEPTGSEGTFDTIRVRLKQPLTQDTLENYFENTRKSGGGDIDSLTIIKGTEMEVEEVLITFSESKDAMNCLQQQHIIDKKILNVQKYDPNDPSLWEMDKALVTGLNPVTTEDTLMNFLEPAAGVELRDLVRGAQEDVAIVVFAEKPDFAKMSKRCKEKKLEGNTLFVQMVEKCQTIYVKGIDKSITYDLVENFFCNKRKSGGGDVEKVDYHPEDGYCIVYFENPSDAKNAAAKEKFTINDREIQAQMYFPCLGLPEQPMNWEDMPYVSYKGNEYIVKFVKNLPKECSQIEEALQKKFVKVEWPKSKSDFTVKLQCTVTKDVKNAKEILKSWKEEAEVEMDRHMNKYVCQKHSTVPEAWQKLLAQLKTLTIDQPDRVAVLLDKKKHTVIVAGYEENTEALTRIILNLIKTEESKIQNQTEKIMKNIPLDFHKCQQLWKTHFGKKLANDFPDLDFQVEINKKEVNLTGKPTEVNEALIKMHEYLMNTKSKSLNISKERYEIFMKKEVKEGFIAEMKAKGNKAVWNVTEDKVEMTSSNSKMAEEALEIFKEFIPEKKIQVKDLVKVLTMHDWQACVKELRDKHNEKLNISSSSSEVCVTATKNIFENVCKQIEHVMKICSEKCRIDHRVVKLSQQQFSYIKYFGQNKIGQIANACNSKELEIKQNQSDCSIEITGNDEDVKKAYESLMRFIKHLREDSCSINKPGAKVFFNSSKGREAMKKAGKDTSCIILNKEGIRHIKENRENGSSRGHRRTSYSLPIKIAECELQFCDKKFIVMKGDVTKLKVDVLVNAANGELDHCGGLALAISKAGGKSIQEESNTYIASNKIVPDGEAIPAQPGELPCKRLIHAVGPRWRNGSHNEEHLLKKAIFKCLELTDKYKHSSIAIPALSAGIFGYPVADSVRVILDAIESYIKTVPSSSIKEVYFCDVDDTIVKEFVICLKKKFGLEVKEFSGDEHVQKSPVENAGSDSEEEKPRRSWSRSEKPICEIKVISGELAKMKVDVIVSSTDKSLNLTLGATSKSLLRAGGESLQEECTMKYKHGVQPGEVAMTKGGNLSCRQVYHGAVKKWDHNRGDALSRFTEFVDNCLRTADKNLMSSMAFPALGTGRLGYPPDLAAKTMLKCCRDFLRQKRSTLLKEIIFVVYHEDKDTLQTFQSVMSSEDVSRGTETSRSSYPQRRSTDHGRRDKSFKLNKLNVEIRQGDITQERSDVVVNSVTESLDLSKGAASKAILKAAGDNIQTECRRGDVVYGDDDASRERPQYQRHQSGNRGSRGHMQQPVEENVTFLILSNSEENIRKAKKSLDEVYKCYDIDASKQKLNDRQIDAIKRIAKGIDCLCTDSKILLMGPANEVNEATVDILKYLHEVKDKEKAQAIQMYVKWQYEISPEKWMTFRDEINMEIETAYKEKKISCVVKDRTGTEYIIDFKKMEEYEKSNFRKKYKIRRMDKAGGTSVGLPVKWAHMKSDQTMVEVKLSPHDKEYKDVLARFSATSGGSVSISEKIVRKLKTQMSASYEVKKIVEIRRVQNPSLYQQYAAKRKEISIRNKRDPEKWLWHGTYPETVDKIINNGFNRSYCGKHGTSYGAGVYFAVNASYSLGYCSGDSRGHKHMFSVQVATGDACHGSGSLHVLPPKPGAGGHVTYDSATDNPSNPGMFVIFHDSQAYPAYHIIFQ
ncbi:protein mono-ADP-ribosyltransferase PARP14 isoform X4 [Magallana gigas]|uniref:protein mono-ADP-ribosyltransferase PARP14 isoform X4 n=1 Tax=Magallana gigas TaxID=29159 RepID=UPI003341D2FA